MAACGASIAEEVDNVLLKGRAPIRLSKGLWARYMRGEVAPQGSIDGSRSSLVRRIDRKFSGTEEIFFHPFWELIDFSRLMGPDELRNHYVSLGPNVWRTFLELGVSKKKRVTPQQCRFWWTGTNPDRLARIRKLPYLDGMAAGLIEARMGFLAQKEEDFLGGIESTLKHLKNIQSKPSEFNRHVGSAWLVVEGILVDHLARMILAPPPRRPAMGEYRYEIENRRIAYYERCKRHAEVVPSSAGVLFLKWRDMANQLWN